MGAHVELITVAPAELPAWEATWRGLEGRAPDAPPFLRFDWLAAWARVFEPRRLAVVRAGAEGEPVALGLLELGPGGRWQFAGRPVASTRGLLAAPADEAGAALGDFVRLHTARAGSKGERHPQIDQRLARMLEGLGSAASFELRILELVQGGRRLGVWIGLERGSVAWYYNLGIDPDALALAPGIAMQLESVRSAIEHGRRRLDLGPGAHPCKLELGGVLDDRVDAHAVSPARRGPVGDGIERLERRARRAAGQVLRR